MPRAFVDTNVLVYAAEEVNPLSRKGRIARELLLQPGLCLSVQVLNEFIANARHPHKLNLSRKQEGEWISQWLQLPVIPLTLDSFAGALEIHLRYGLSHWDSLIVFCAQSTGCEFLYSEDLSHGQMYETTQVINPFRNVEV